MYLFFHYNYLTWIKFSVFLKCVSVLSSLQILTTYCVLMFKSRQTLKNQGKADCQPYERFISRCAKSSDSAGEECRGGEERRGGGDQL